MMVHGITSRIPNSLINGGQLLAKRLARPQQGFEVIARLGARRTVTKRAF